MGLLTPEISTTNPMPWQGTASAAETNQNPFGYQFDDPYGYRVKVNGQRRDRIYDWNGREIDTGVNQRQTGSDGFTTLFDDNWNPVGFGFARQPGMSEDFWKERRDYYMNEQPDNIKNWLRQMYGTDNPDANAQYTSQIGRNPNGIGLNSGLLSGWQADQPIPGQPPRGPSGVDLHGAPTIVLPGNPPPGGPDVRRPADPGGAVNLGLSGTPQDLSNLGIDQNLLNARLARIRR